MSLTTDHPVVYAEARDLDSQWLRPGDQVLVRPAAPDSDATWVRVWGPAADPIPDDARWLTVAALLRSDAADVMAVQLEDGSPLALVAGLDQVRVRTPRTSSAADFLPALPMPAVADLAVAEPPPPAQSAAWSVGRRLAYHRHRRNMSQQALGDLLGLSKSWVDKVERGSRQLEKVSVLMRVAEVLRVPPTEFLPEPSERPS